MYNLDYDDDHDIMYIKFKDMSNSYGDEIENGVVISKDMNSDEITGVILFDFDKMYKKFYKNKYLHDKIERKRQETGYYNQTTEERLAKLQETFDNTTVVSEEEGEVHRRIYEESKY